MKNTFIALVLAAFSATVSAIDFDVVGNISGDNLSFIATSYRDEPLVINRVIINDGRGPCRIEGSVNVSIPPNGSTSFTIPGVSSKSILKCDEVAIEHGYGADRVVVITSSPNLEAGSLLGGRSGSIQFQSGVFSVFAEAQGKTLAFLTNTPNFVFYRK